MNKEDYVRITKDKLENPAQKIMIEQIDKYYEAKKFQLPNHKYKIGDDVNLEKGTLLHGTYKNIDGLQEILKDGLISSWFVDGRSSKYPSSVGVWNLKYDYMLKDYINFYSGGTIMYCGIFKDGINTKDNKTSVIPYDELDNLIDINKKIDCHMWTMEQTKEARFLPSLVQDRVQVGIIFNGNNEYIKGLLDGDVLNFGAINDTDVKDFVNPDYYERFISERKNKDDFFTDRESAILFGIPANFIEGILVGRIYEKDAEMLKKIKSLLPNSYICNLDGKVIY